MNHSTDLKSQMLAISSINTVDTIAELLTLNNLPLDTVIKVNGYYTATDGATHYRIVSSVDNGSGIAYNNVYLNILYTNELYSTWFGCKQDGITDDTINFQRFLNFFGKAKLYVPQGIIKISSMLTIMGMFRNAENWGDNRSYRTLEFQGAAFDWNGIENACSINIFCHYKSIIDGMTFVHNSLANFVNVCAVWDSQIKNFYFDTLKFNDTVINSQTELPYGLIDFDIYYQFNNIFETGYILKNISINSTTKNLTEKTYGINSLKFNNIVIQSQKCNYCVEIYGDRFLNNIGFNDCDLSYASKALFYLEKENPNCTISLAGCYFDSAIPLIEDYNFKCCNFNLYHNFEASNDSKQVFALKTVNFTNSSKLGDKGIEPNYLPMGVMNLALNGDLSYSTISWDWIRNMNVAIVMLDREYGMHGKVVSMTFSGNGKYVEFPLVAYIPFTGMYTLGLRLKKVSGTGTIQFSYNNIIYKNYDMNLLDDNEDFIIASYGNSSNLFSQGESIKCVLASVTDTTQLVLELIEIIALPGKQILFNLPLAPAAQMNTSITPTLQTPETNTASDVTVAINNISGYTEDILFRRIEDIAYYGSETGNLPSYTTTKHIICDEQTLGMYDMLASRAIQSLLQKPLGIITHSSDSNRQVSLPLTIGHYTDTYYVTIRVDSISESAPSLTLYNVNSTNSAQVLLSLQAIPGIQKLSVKVGGSKLEASSICEPMIGISEADVAAGKYITYEVLGIYDSNLLADEENFINDIKFAGSPIKSSDTLGFDIIMNNQPITISKEIRCLNGVSDYIREGKLHRRIKKLLITGDMILNYEPKWTEKYTIGEKSAFVFLKPELNYGFKQSMLPQRSNQSYVIAPGFSRYTLTTGHGDKNIRSIGAAIPYGVGITQQCIVVRLKNTDLGISSNADLSTEEIINLFSEWFVKNPTYIYYACLDEEVEELNATLPTLQGDKTINTLYFTTHKSMEVYPHIKVQRQVGPYMNLDGKAWLAIGDSLTSADGASLAYIDLASYLIPNCITYNYGKSGASIAPYANVNNRAVGKWIDEVYDSLPEYVSIVTIMLGTNDRQNDLFIGSVEDALEADAGTGAVSTSFLAYYKHLIIKLYEKYPEAEIVLLTPPRNSKFADTTVINNAAQNTFGDIIQAVKDLAAYFCLRCYDMNHESGVNQLNSSNTLKLSWLARRTNFLTVDGLHYNDLGHELIFRYITSVL